MTFYLSITLITEVLMLTMIMHIVGYSGFTKSQRTWYILTFVCIMICSLAEFAVHCGYYDSKFKVILSIITVMQFSLAPMLGILFVGALGLKSQKKIGIPFLCANLLVEIICAPFESILIMKDILEGNYLFYMKCFTLQV